MENKAELKGTNITVEYNKDGTLKWDVKKDKTITEKYKIIDIYEDRDTIGYASNLNTVYAIARERIADTDGECLIEVRELNVETNKYRFLKVLETV